MISAIFSPLAQDDLLSALQWIARDNPNAAQGLLDAALSAAARIGAHPEIGALRSDLADEPYRFLALTGYSYIVVYNASRKPPLIVRIVHGARDLPELLQDLS